MENIFISVNGIVCCLVASHKGGEASNNTGSGISDSVINSVAVDGTTATNWVSADGLFVTVYALLSMTTSDPINSTALMTFVWNVCTSMAPETILVKFLSFWNSTAVKSSLLIISSRLVEGSPGKNS